MTVPAAIAGTRLGRSTGLAEQEWVTRVREKLQDWPDPKVDQFVGDGVSGVRSAGATPIFTSKKPINEAASSISVGVAGVDFPIDTVNPPAVGKVFIDYTNGAVYFESPPAIGAVVQIGYEVVRYTNQEILEALVGGLRELFPAVGKTYVDTSIPIVVNQWDYTLPAWAQDPRSRILAVEIVEQATSTEPFRVLRNWRPNGDGTLNIPGAQAFSPTAMLRITGWGPYLYLGDLEPQLKQLPIYYAVGVLMSDTEARMRRLDTQQPQTSENAHAHLESMQVGRHYMNLFEASRAKLERTAGPNLRRKILTAYERESYPYNG